MGYRPLRTLLDLAVHGFNLKVACRFCGRWRIVDAGGLMWLHHKRGWPINVEEVGRHMRCSGCGRKDSEVTLTERDPTGLQPVRRQHVALDVVDGRGPPCPSGVDSETWAKADVRERKRLVARARG